MSDPQNVVYRVKGSNGAVVRATLELDSEVVGELDTLEEVTGLEVSVASNGLERVRIAAPVEGWVSRRLLEPKDSADARETKVAVERARRVEKRAFEHRSTTTEAVAAAGTA